MLLCVTVRRAVSLVRRLPYKALGSSPDRAITLNFRLSADVGNYFVSSLIITESCLTILTGLIIQCLIIGSAALLSANSPSSGIITQTAPYRPY